MTPLSFLNMTRSSLLSIFFLAYVLSIISPCHCQTTAPLKFPAILIFGDSTVDTGNNNYISTAFKANHTPYGVDYPSHEATGRFSNGRLVPDMLASEVGIKQSLPPFLMPSLSDDDIRTGVSFASAGSGFDSLTTAISGVIQVSQQPEMFKQYIARLKGIVGDGEANHILSNALILISAATNDFIFNWYDIPSRKLGFKNISHYQDFLQQKLHDLIKEIYTLGGRKFAVAGLAPIGCVPFQISAKFKNPMNRTCIEEQNSDAVVYNTKLQRLLPEIQATLEGSKVVYANLYDPLIDIFIHPQKYGFLDTKKGCCGTGFVEMGPLCNVLTPPCSDASKFLFWDAVHPTEDIYEIAAKHLIESVLPSLY